jgi:hypothetical protein
MDNAITNIKVKHFYYNELENSFIFVKNITTRQDGVSIVWCAPINTNDPEDYTDTITYYANTFLDRYKLVGFIIE